MKLVQGPRDSGAQGPGTDFRYAMLLIKVPCVLHFILFLPPATCNPLPINNPFHTLNIMAESKKNRDYIPFSNDDRAGERAGSKEYSIKGTLTEYPISKWKKSEVQYGLHFSQHVRGMFLFPKAALRRIIGEKPVAKELVVPFVVVLIAGILTAVGSWWGIVLPNSILYKFFLLLTSSIWLFVLPIWFVLLWLFWTGVLHVMSSVISGRDVLDTTSLQKIFKAVGFTFVPAFLNILPMFSLATGYWSWILCAWAVEMNYGLSKKSALLATAPLLFATIAGTFIRLSIL